MRTAMMVDRSEEIEELKQKLEKLTATVKSNTFKGVQDLRKTRKKILTNSSSPKNKVRGKKIPRNMSKGPATTSAGPFQTQSKTISMP